MEEIVVDNLTKKFKISNKEKKIKKCNSNLFTAVDNVSFSVNKGETFGLLGTNGAGKTTTLRILSTLIKPTIGEAFVSGSSIISNPEKVRRKIGFLTSEMKLDDAFTPNYLFDFFLKLHDVDIKEFKEYKSILFNRFGIEKYSETRISKLSTGIKQKLSLVISLAHKPEVVFLDEPTNGLDIVVAKQVIDFLLELKNNGVTIILSTHIFSLADKICDNIGIIIDGKLFVCDRINKVKGRLSLEEAFFEIYDKNLGEVM